MICGDLAGKLLRFSLALYIAVNCSSLGAWVGSWLSKRCHHGRWFLKRTFQLLVSVLLDSLSVLKLLDQLHLELLHLHDFFFLLLTEVILIVHAIIMGPLHLLQTSLSVLLNLHRSQSLLLIDDLILHAVFLLDLKALELLFLLVLLLDDLRLFGFLSSWLENGLLDFAFLICTLFLDREVALGYHALVFVLHLVVVDFLLNKDDKQLGTWYVMDNLQAYLLNTVFVSLFKREDLISALLGIVNLFPSLILLLLKQGDSICQKLGITLNAINSQCPVRDFDSLYRKLTHLLFTTALHLSQALCLGFEHGLLLRHLCIVSLRMISHLLSIHWHLLLLLLLLLSFSVHCFNEVKWLL